MESKSADARVTFGALQTRLITLVNARIQNGDFTERGLARILGISQPQIHNVLKGARKLRPELADRLISNLEISVLDLMDPPELRRELLSRPPELSNALPGSHLEPKRFNGGVQRKPSGREARSMRTPDQRAS